MMVADMENAAVWLVASLLTTDGTSLGGFSSRMEALRYDYASPRRWFPAAVTVTEDGTTPFPALTSLTVTDARSRSEDLAALLLGHAMFFGMTDARNAAVGQRLGLTLAFDGDPFAADDGLANGQDTCATCSRARMAASPTVLRCVLASPHRRPSPRAWTRRRRRSELSWKDSS